MLTNKNHLISKNPSKNPTSCQKLMVVTQSHIKHQTNGHFRKSVSRDQQTSVFIHYIKLMHLLQKHVLFWIGVTLWHPHILIMHNCYRVSSLSFFACNLRNYAVYATLNQRLQILHVLIKGRQSIKYFFLCNIYIICRVYKNIKATLLNDACGIVFICGLTNASGQRQKIEVKD